MKLFVDRLQVGDTVHALVTEVLDASEVIISLGGDLSRAVNETGRRLRAGDTVGLRVVSVKPLKLRVLENERRLGRLDRTV